MVYYSIEIDYTEVCHPAMSENIQQHHTLSGEHMKNNGWNPVAETVLLKVIGEDGLNMVKQVMGSELTDERIAEISNLDLNFVRKTLFILYENRLATYRRENDEESGWLTYYWTLHMDNLSGFFDGELRKTLRNLERRLEYEKENIFYACEPCGLRVSFDEAMDNSFKCPNCGSMLMHWENQPIIDMLEKKVAELRDRMGLE